MKKVIAFTEKIVTNSDKLFYNGLKTFGLITFISGVNNMGLWAISSACFLGMLFLGKSNNKN